MITGDHIIPRSVCPELDNSLYNLEMMRMCFWRSPPPANPDAKIQRHQRIGGLLNYYHREAA
jgi:hypothetical protein